MENEKNCITADSIIGSNIQNLTLHQPEWIDHINVSNEDGSVDKIKIPIVSIPNTSDINGILTACIVNQHKRISTLEKTIKSIQKELKTLKKGAVSDG